ncbi:MAG: sugar phosphate isomerase/epimerase family protein, partial [Candidatus Dormibacteraceae bacterium]
MPTAIDRAHLAGAPISWGVCEVPGWGPALPPERALSEMRRLGFTATELGPAGYLGADAASIRRALDRWGLGALGGFQPLVLHDPAQRAETRRRTETAARLLQAVGARHFVTAAVADLGWSKPSPLGGAQWQALFDGVERVRPAPSQVGDGAGHEMAGADRLQQPGRRLGPPPRLGMLSTVV